MRGVMKISFKSFALAKGFGIPTKALAVANSLNFHPPVSLRALIGTAGPFEPIMISYATSATGTSFQWYDEANLPPWVWEADGSPYGQPDMIRQASSFEFKLWQSPENNLIVDDMVPYGVPSGSGLPAGYLAGVLNGNFTYQIIAFNGFGTASTPKVGPIDIVPPAPGPHIDVIKVDDKTNKFQIKGTGFGSWANQTVYINVDRAIGAAGAVSQEPVPTVLIDDQGEFNTSITATVCAGHPADSLRFSVTPENTVGSISNYALNTCT